jgi:hypothetical protein
MQRGLRAAGSPPSRWRPYAARLGHSVGEREPGVASVSAPVRSPRQGHRCGQRVRPIERLSRQPGRLHAPR